MVFTVVDRLGIHIQYFLPLLGVCGRMCFRVAAEVLCLPACCLYHLEYYQNVGIVNDVGARVVVTVVVGAFAVVELGICCRYFVVDGYK